MPVKPGELLGFVQVLRKAKLFPLPVGLHTQHPGRRYATPFLVVPAVPADPGTNRSLSGAPARLHFAGIRIVDEQGSPTATPIAGQTYGLVADVANLGSGGAYSGIAEFYVGSPDFFDQAAASRPIIRAYGYSGFVAMPDSIVPVRCPIPWIPATPTDATSSVLVQVYDLCLDPLAASFNARTDRHVGRLDLSDFSGRWAGRLVGINIPDEGDVTFDIIQNQLTVSVTGSEIASPLVGRLDRDHVIVVRLISETERQGWTFTLKTVETLHVREDDVTPGSDDIYEADLHRVS